MFLIERRTDDDCALWYCALCSAAGTLTFQPGTAPAAVIVEACDAHLDLAPHCEAPPAVIESASRWYVEVLRAMRPRRELCR